MALPPPSVPALPRLRRRRSSGVPSATDARPNLYRGWGTNLYAAFGPPTIAGLHHRLAADLAAGLPPRARWLDIGCGPGDLPLALAALRPDLLVVGVDPAASAIVRCRRRAASAGLANGRFVCAPVERLPFPDACFAGAAAIGSFKHWSDPARGLAEAARVLRPGARLHLFELDPLAGPDRFAGIRSRYPHIAAALMRRLVLPCSLPRAQARAMLAGGALALERDDVTPDLPFYEFVLRR